MIETADNYSRIPLSVLVHITSASKDGMMQVVWPSIFRGIEQPDEFHPSQALRKLMKKFAEEHPDPFAELKRLAEDHHLSGDVMDFLEQPLYGRIKGLANTPNDYTESGLDLEYMQDRMNDFVYNPFEAGMGKLNAAKRSEELELYLGVKKETERYERDLTVSYRSWLARKLGSNLEGHVGGWGNMGDSLTTKEIATLRRDEKIPFICMAGYDISKEFDMTEHNRDAFLAIHEQVGNTWQKGYAVLIAYGRIIQIAETMEEAHTLAGKLKFFEDEYLAAPLTRDTFVELAGRSR